MKKNMKLGAILAGVLATGTAAGFSLVVPATAQDMQDQAPVKLTEDQARKIALKAAAGDVIETELENEDGVMVYSFEIRAGGIVREVEVDANTGNILENEIEGADKTTDERGDEEKREGETE